VTENPARPGDSDDVMERLRAADPAAGADLDLEQTWATVRARTALTDGSADVVDDLAAARARRNKTWMVRVASVAAGAVLFGGGGYAIGHAGNDGAPSAETGTLIGTGNPRDATAAGQSAGLVTPGTTSQSAPGVGTAYWGGGRTVFHASGLSDVAGSAKGWAYNPSSAFSKATVTRVAKALGVSGEAKLFEGMWSVGATDGSGPSLLLQPDGMASVKFYDPSKDPFACRGVAAPAAGVVPGAPGGTTPDKTNPTGGIAEPAPAPDCTPGDVPPAPAGTAAIARAKTILASLGVDVGSFEFETSNGGQDALSYVSAFQVVDGQRTGTSWGLSLAAAGVQSLDGWLAPMVSIGSYDIVSEQDAVARLSDPRFGAGYAGGPVPLVLGTKAAVAPDGTTSAGSGGASASGDGSVSSQPAPTLPPVLPPGSAISWPLENVTIVKAHLGLAAYSQTDGSQTLLPTYRLSSADGRAWTVIAITDQHLDFSAR